MEALSDKSQVKVVNPEPQAPAAPPAPVADPNQKSPDEVPKQK
jgi:hypothetical protein